MCSTCGANVPAPMNACMACNGAPSASMSLPVPQGGANWVQLRVELGCVQCGNRSALNTLSEGVYFCTSCQADRKFDVDLWHEKIIPLSAAVGDVFWTNMCVFPPWPGVLPDEDWLDDQEGWDDLSGSIPAIMRDIFPRIGYERPRLRAEQEGTVMNSGGMKTATYAAEMFPGHPLCDTCKVPLVVSFPSRGVAQTQCPHCRASDTHKTPDSVLMKCPDLLAALAPELVQGRAPARLEQKPGTAAVAILCSGCGSALAMQPGDRIVKCQYCSTTSFIPERAMAVPAGPPQKKPWWIAVYSPSSLRRLLMQPGAGQNRPSDPDPFDF